MKTPMTDVPSPATADLCDEYEVAVLDPILRDFGARRPFGGRIETVKVFEDNVLVRKTLEQRGDGCVLVVDGGGSTRCALLGDRLAQMACDNGWEGVVVYGAVRDAAELATIDLGVKAVAPCPRRSVKHGHGQRRIPLRFGGVTFTPGHFVYADADGVVVSETSLG